MKNKSHGLTAQIYIKIFIHMIEYQKIKYFCSQDKIKYQRW